MSNELSMLFWWSFKINVWSIQHVKLHRAFSVILFSHIVLSTILDKSRSSPALSLNIRAMSHTNKTARCSLVGLATSQRFEPISLMCHPESPDRIHLPLINLLCFLFSCLQQPWYLICWQIGCNMHLFLSFLRVVGKSLGPQRSPDKQLDNQASSTPILHLNPIR